LRDGAILGSSEAARSKLEALLCDSETRSAKQRISASGEATRDLLPTHFWENSASLWVLTSVDDGVDYLEIHWPDYEDIYHGRSEFLVRRADVERWERLYPELAAPPAPEPPPPPPPSPPKTTAGAEARAIAHLKPLLDLRRDAMSKGEAWEECEHFTISYAGFERRVWPAAREKAGLEREAPAGRKKRQPAEIESTIDQIVGPAPDKKPGGKSSGKSRRKSRS